MKKYKFIILFLLVACTSLNGNTTYEEVVPRKTESIKYILKQGVIYRVREKAVAVEGIKGTVLYMKYYNNTLYYMVQRKDDDSEKYYAGIKKKDENIETAVVVADGTKIGRIDFDGTSLYFHAVYTVKDGDFEEKKFMLYRYSYDTKETDHLDRVYDFLLLKEGAAVLMKKSSGYMVQYLHADVPVTIKGNVSFISVKNNRLIFLTNGKETEVIDIIRKVNVYTYSPDKEYVIPDTYNVKIECRDTNTGHEKVSGLLNFYRVYVDGIEFGRTNTAPGEVSKVYKARVGEGYHFIRLERWILDRVRKKYTRANNILQPRQVRVFFPSKRVIILKCLFNGRRYRVFTELMVK